MEQLSKNQLFRLYSVMNVTTSRVEKMIFRQVLSTFGRCPSARQEATYGYLQKSQLAYHTSTSSINVLAFVGVPQFTRVGALVPDHQPVSLNQFASLQTSAAAIVHRTQYLSFLTCNKDSRLLLYLMSDLDMCGQVDGLCFSNFDESARRYYAFQEVEKLLCTPLLLALHNPPAAWQLRNLIMGLWAKLSNSCLWAPLQLLP